MSGTVSVDIAASAVSALNGADLSPPFTATRTYLAVYDIADLGVLRVDVIAATMAVERLDLSSRHRFTYQTDIVV